MRLLKYMTDNKKKQTYKFKNPIKVRPPIPLRTNRIKPSGKVYKRVKKVNWD